jgi:poly-gamma-glutamate synthesis protein (capsule biosynthesis protein)
MSVKLLCLGDIMLGENLSHYKRGIRTKFQLDYSKLIPKALSEHIRKDVDLIFYNLEYSLAEQKGFLNKTIHENIYKGTLESLSVFEGAPVVVSVANNHFGQHGVEGSKFTKQLLRKKGIYIVGETGAPVEITINDSKTLFWGVTLVGDKYGNGEYFKSTYDTVMQDLKFPSKKNEDERWLISIHWGDEYLNTPSVEQRELAKKLIEKGFDVIIGHHAHTINPIEFYNNKLIIYSLGNFLFDQDFSRRTTTGLVINVLLNAKPSIFQSFLSRQKDYKINKLTEVAVADITWNPSFKFYKTKKKLLTYWYRMLMKVEEFIHFRELDKETVGYMKDKFKNKFTGAN